MRPRGVTGVVPALLALVAAIMLAVGLAGCGGSKSTSASEQTATWADGMCSALVDWQNSMKAAGENVSKGQLSKQSLQDTANAVSDANKQLRDDLDSLGKPPTATTDQAKTDLQQLADDLSKNADKIREALSGVSGASDLTAALTTAAGAVQAMGKDLQTTASQLQSLSKDDTWSKAFKSSESCKKLSG